MHLRNNEKSIGGGLLVSWNGHYFRVRSVDGNEVHIDAYAFENLCHYAEDVAQDISVGGEY